MTTAGQEGLVEEDEAAFCEPEECDALDMEAAARRDVKAEIYAIQSYDNFGCGTCVASGAPAGRGLHIAWVGALLGLVAVRRRRA